jgi:hypothetical protein
MRQHGFPVDIEKELNLPHSRRLSGSQDDACDSIHMVLSASRVHAFPVGRVFLRRSDENAFQFTPASFLELCGDFFSGFMEIFPLGLVEKHESLNLGRGAFHDSFRVEERGCHRETRDRFSGTQAG